MSSNQNPPDRGVSRYSAATDALTEALVEVWRACSEQPGVNLPEALSYALDRAARSLGFILDEDGNPLPGEEITQAAGDGLVQHRHGSWKADHVRPLAYTLDLLSGGAPMIDDYDRLSGCGRTSEDAVVVYLQSAYLDVDEQRAVDLVANADDVILAAKGLNGCAAAAGGEIALRDGLIKRQPLVEDPVAIYDSQPDSLHRAGVITKVTPIGVEANGLSLLIATNDERLLVEGDFVWNGRTWIPGAWWMVLEAVALHS